MFRSLLLTPRLVSSLSLRTMGCIRLKSLAAFDDEKLKRIIESSNLGPVKPKPIEAKSTTIETVREQETPTETYTPPPEVAVEDLPSLEEQGRSELSKRLEKYLDSLQYTIFTATKTLNDVTGYSNVEKLKNAVETLEQDLKSAKVQVKSCKQAYTDAVHRRSTLQKEMNDLLTRKHNWDSKDLERFTELYRNDHTYEHEETSAQDKFNEAEQLADAIQLKLTQLILTRYHEEQIWSDKIRRASTWGTWILMGINMFLFIIATFIVEPWKRRKLVGAFEEKVRVMMEKSEPVSEIIPVPAPISVPTEVALVTFQTLTWAKFVDSVKSSFYAIKARNTEAVQFEKTQLSVLATLLAVTGCGLGVLVSHLLS